MCLHKTKKIFLVLLLVATAARAFECPTAGIFPVDDCSGFHVCGYNALNGAVEVLQFVECPDGKLYNIMKHKCQPPSVFTCPQ
ncbi:hypothetical protein SK128_016155 [Halocaridina rubra]|uniref:Chitin-binding type-2 domain-containing protein n=1 Tax=Halocaridina rubra TaxID=373956 RepID=A0AAN8WX37_HALRR